MFLSGLKVRQEFITCSVVVKLQSAPFFGFFKGEQRHKGVFYCILPYKVESTVSVGLHLEPVILQQIHRLPQGKAKSKLVGFGSESQGKANITTS